MPMMPSAISNVHAKVSATPSRPRIRPYGTHESAHSKTPIRNFTGWTSRAQATREELQRGLGLRLLVAPEIDASLFEEPPGVERHCERLTRDTLGRELDDAAVVGIQPQFANQLAAEFFG